MAIRGSAHTGRMSRAVAIITDLVRERVRREGADLGEVGVAERFIRDEVQRYSERALGGSLPVLADESSAASQVLATLTGFGVLQPYFDDPGIEEIWINAPDRVLMARDGIAALTDLNR